MAEKIKSSSEPKISLSGNKVGVYTIQQVAELSHYCENSVKEHRKNGDFPNAYKMGNKWQITLQDFIKKYGFNPETGEVVGTNKK